MPTVFGEGAFRKLLGLDKILWVEPPGLNPGSFIDAVLGCAGTVLGKKTIIRADLSTLHPQNYEPNKLLYKVVHFRCFITVTKS